MAEWITEDVAIIGLAFQDEGTSDGEENNSAHYSSVSLHAHQSNYDDEQNQTEYTAELNDDGQGFTNSDMTAIMQAMESPCPELGSTASTAAVGELATSEPTYVEDDRQQGSSQLDIILQRRPGTHHGRGGRPRGLSRSRTSQQVCDEVGSVAVKAFASRTGGVLRTVVTQLRSTAILLLENNESWEPSPTYEEDLENMLRSIKANNPKKGYTILASPVLCISSNIGTRDNTGLPSGNIKDRYASCMWLDVQGTMHCLCFGSTKYRILRPLFNSWSFSDNQVCVHMQGLLLFIKAVATSMNFSLKFAGKVLSHLYAVLSPSEIGEYIRSVPRIHITHSVKSNANLTVLAELEASTRELFFVPLRTVRRTMKRNVCLFCDNTGRRECHHVRSINVLQDEDIEDPGSYTTQSYNFDAISHLPVGPVNCSRSLKVDINACEISRSGYAFLARAPLKCQHSGCNEYRDEKSRKVYTDGVLMCTAGPCMFHYEYFECSSCRRQIGAEGREHCIVIEKVTSAATHAFLRRELVGLALTVGTLTGRMKHFHSQVTAAQYFKVLPTTARCLSLTSLRSLALIMLRLMCSNPPKELFTCLTCEFENGQRRTRLRALCMDGINQGHLRRCQKAFQNISEECHSLPVPRSKGRSSSRDRPLDNIIRRTGTIEILLSAVQGRKLCCTKGNIVEFAAAVRLTSEDVLPSGFFHASICGRSNADHFNDIGINSAVAKLRAVLKALLRVDILLSRLLHPLESFLTSSSPRRTDIAHMIRNKLRSLPGTVSVTDTHEVANVCWQSPIREFRDVFVKNDLLRLLKMVLQGPATQFIRRSSVKSMQKLASICCKDMEGESIAQDLQGTSLLMALQNSSVLTEHSEEGNTLKSSLVLQAGIRSITLLEEQNQELGKRVRQSFGSLFRECVRVVTEFYSFYESDRGTESSVSFARSWRSGGSMDLRRQLMEKYPNHPALNGNAFEIACKTGFFFPAHPQIRPLAFNVEEQQSHEKEVEQGYCEKEYAEGQKQYTPGCLTFVCSCFHPLILGLKATHVGEGTRIVIDSILSRFSVLPEYVIYDYSCGLYSSARHTLWWAVEDTTVVSDFFHSKNHCCSPSYDPGSHVEVNKMNTVAHEQRNRAIKEICKSLRNGSQEFYISLLGYQASILNLQAKSLAHPNFSTRPPLTSEFDIEWCYFDCLKLRCQCCPSD